MTDAALVLFSGGQDSSVCLAWALERYARVETVGFDYGQRHVIEMERARGRASSDCRPFPALGRAPEPRTMCWTSRVSARSPRAP